MAHVSGVVLLMSTIEASTRADSVYTPILDAAMKATRLRSTLTVFERNKFFFNLPGALLQAIEIVCLSLLSQYFSYAG